MKIDVPIINAFVDEHVGGNPAGVVLNAQQYSQDQKQRIAATVGLSETAFVSPSSIADFKLEFFTPTRQIAHCGHATIATFSYLRQIGMLPNDQTSKETIDGRREILMEGDAAYMEQSAPQYTELDQGNQLRAMDSIGVKLSDLLEGAEPCMVNTGNSFLIVGLRNLDTIKSISPIMEEITIMSEAYELIGYYVFSPQVIKAGRDAGARMFAPRYGIDEESATGMAAEPLACYLHDKLKNKKSQFLIEQGYLMSQPSPSVIDVRLQTKHGSIVSLMAGGKAAVSETRHIEI
jgi:PhzF family phenazine biosynthesis protein